MNEILLVCLVQKLAPLKIHGSQHLQQLLQMHGLDSHAVADAVDSSGN